MLWSAGAVLVGLAAWQRGRSAGWWTGVALLASPLLAGWLLRRLPVVAAGDWVADFDAYCAHEARAAVAQYLARHSGDEATVLNDVVVGSEKVDHLVLSRRGVYVVGVWVLPAEVNGQRLLRQHDGRLWSGGSPLDGASVAARHVARAARAAAESMPQVSSPVPVLLIPDARLESPPSTLHDVQVMVPAELPRLIARTPDVLSHETLAQVVAALRAQRLGDPADA